jgi:hypothetical protein
MRPVLDFGPVARLRLPPDWEEKPHTPSPPYGPKSRTFHPPGVQQATIVLHSSGRANDKDARRAWLHVVRHGRPRPLRSAEQKELQEVPIYGFSEKGFQRRAARTENINGRRVLVVEGHWADHGLDMYIVVADDSRDGSHTHEIYFAAPHRMYALYLDAWLASLRTIRWKPRGIGDRVRNLVRALRFWKR